MPREGVGTPVTLYVDDAAPEVSFGSGTGPERVGFLPPAVQLVFFGSSPSKLISLKTSSFQACPNPPICTLGFQGGTLLGVKWLALPECLE